MPRVAYSEEEREKIRETLIVTGLQMMARQGIRHTTVEQIYKKVGISRTFFYSFFPGKEELIVEALYFQQPRILDYVRKLMEDPSLSWREAVLEFLRACCYGEKSGIAVMTLEEQKMLFGRLSEESRRQFRERQVRLFGKILETFGIEPDPERIGLFTNLCLTIIIIRRAVPESLPFLIPEAAEPALAFQMDAITDWMEKMRKN